jgi:hypothetical protein
MAEMAAADWKHRTVVNAVDQVGLIIFSIQSCGRNAAPLEAYFK